MLGEKGEARSEPSVLSKVQKCIFTAWPPVPGFKVTFLGAHEIAGSSRAELPGSAGTRSGAWCFAGVEVSKDMRTLCHRVCREAATAPGPPSGSCAPSSHGSCRETWSRVHPLPLGLAVLLKLMALALLGALGWRLGRRHVTSAPGTHSIAQQLIMGSPETSAITAASPWVDGVDFLLCPSPSHASSPLKAKET